MFITEFDHKVALNSFQIMPDVRCQIESIGNVAAIGFKDKENLSPTNLLIMPSLFE